ncbi:fasciclin domain-containing protein [Methanosarcina sp. T3]|uniref:fasciclin domain-containing protein n=1 Tax=Methanosarcina sp. T3 TaxID=3439062 RepID=UPI003F84A5CF
MLILAGIIFISGCAEDTQEEETGAEEGTPVEEATVTEGAGETAGEEVGEGLVPGEDEGMTPGEEEPGLDDNVTAEEGNQTIVDAAEAAGYTTFVSLVKEAGLEGTLNEGTYTVFAPTNEAFDSLPEGTLDDLQANEEALKNVLLYHVAEGKLDVAEMESVETLQGGILIVDATSDPMKIGDANVVWDRIEVSNGYIYPIDAVLIPPK